MAGALAVSSPASAQAHTQANAENIRVTLLGTAGGPPVRVGAAGIATLVEAGGDRFLFDAGRGVMQQIARAGLSMNDVTKLFLTHLHSDHVVDVPDLMLTPWSGSGRKVPLEAWGPPGTQEMFHHLAEAFDFDIRIRQADEKLPVAGVTVLAHDVLQGVVYQEHGVTITAFEVDHGPVKPAYGYRVDYHGRSVTLSGDTRPSDNLVTFARGTDVLVYEATDPETLRKRNFDQQHLEAVIAHHSTPEQAATIFNRVMPRLAVFSHSTGASTIVEQVKRSYAGRVEMGEDLMVIDIGARIDVTH